jgi:ADP-ribose pyrophosphatase
MMLLRSRLPTMPVAEPDVGTHDFETVSSETVYTGRVLALRADEVLMPGGRTAIREVVEHYGAVAVAAVDADDRLLMIHQYRHPLGRRIWELPAGLLDLAGEDPVEGAARELLEETGVVAGDWRVLIDVAVSPGFCDEAVRVYLARDLTPGVRPDAENEEADLSVHWFDLGEAVGHVLSGEIVNATAAAGVLAAYAAVVDGRATRPADAPWPDRPEAFAARQLR